MPLNISGYSDPGVYLGEIVVPGNVSINTVPLVVCLVGIGNRDKRVSNEAVIRGQISDVTLSVSATPSAHDANVGSENSPATKYYRSNRKTSQTVITADDVALDSNVDFAYRPASITSNSIAVSAPLESKLLGLSMDGKIPVVIKIKHAAVPGATVISGNLITAEYVIVAGGGGAMTAAELAGGINKALAAATSLGYGAAYGNVAAVSGATVVLTSPLSTSASDVVLWKAFPAASDITVTAFGTSGTSGSATLPAAFSMYRAATVVRITNAAYSATAVYKATYVTRDGLIDGADVDSLENANVQTMVRVGSYANATTFISATDYQLTGDTVDWSPDTAAAFTGTLPQTFDVNPDDKILLSLDGKASISIDVRGAGAAVPGYVDPADGNAATAAEIVLNINAVLANSVTYGPAYQAVATVGAGNVVVLTSPTQGQGSLVEIGAPSVESASAALTGLVAAQFPYSARGAGKKPSAGTTYFVTYEYTRATDDYNVVKRFYDPQSLLADVGQPTSANALANAGLIAFENGAPSVAVCQVNDSNFNGSPTETEFQTALDAAGESSVPTEICALSTALAVQSRVISHLSDQNSPVAKHYRRGWFGMARGTLVGDKDTADTFVYAAMRTFQVPGDSPARGRMLLVAPASITRTMTEEDGTLTDISLDGSYLAVAVAAKMTSFTSPAEALLRKTVSGFKIDDFPTYLRAERATLADSGVCVVTLDAGKLLLTDPVTTEAGGGRLVTFMEPSASPQKDSVTTNIEQVVNANLVGVVPTDLSKFLLLVKGHIGGAIQSLIASGAIGPFKTDDGVTRDIDLTKDIVVFQDATDPTMFRFKYYFNLRLPAKRFMGEYSVNNPFF